YVDQFNANEGLVAHEIGTARELIEVAGSRIDGWVACVGTGSTFVGVARGLRAAYSHVVMAPVEPSGCEVLAGKPITKRKHLLQGTGYGFVPPHWDPRLVSRCLAVTDDEALAWKRRLAGEEGLHVGFSAAANVCAAIDGRNSVRWYGRDSPLRLGNEILTAVVVLAESLLGSMAGHASIEKLPTEWGDLEAIVTAIVRRRHARVPRAST